MREMTVEEKAAEYDRIRDSLWDTARKWGGDRQLNGVCIDP